MRGKKYAKPQLNAKKKLKSSFQHKKSKKYTVCLKSDQANLSLWFDNMTVWVKGFFQEKNEYFKS